MLTKLIFAASFSLLILAALLFYLNIGGASNFMVVGIDTFRGINFLGSARDVWGILIAGGVINIVNVVLARAFSKRDRFLTNILPFASLLISLLILIVIGVIITSN